MRRGDLIYIPSDVMLCKFGLDGATVSSYLKLSKPIHLLIMEEEDALYKVLYEGQNWYVKKNQVYEVKNE
tara:strand:+ start:309 stop:518 length:210 start_codon:yes stop_codon:yes gene_type:complete